MIIGTFSETGEYAESRLIQGLAGLQGTFSSFSDACCGMDTQRIDHFFLSAAINNTLVIPASISYRPMQTVDMTWIFRNQRFHFVWLLPWFTTINHRCEMDDGALGEKSRP